MNADACKGAGSASGDSESGRTGVCGGDREAGRSPGEAANSLRGTACRRRAWP